MLKTKNQPRTRWIGDDEPEQVSQLSQQCFGDGERFSLEYVLHFCSRPDSIPRVIETPDGLWAGYCFFVLHEQVVWVRQLAIREPLRRQGLASKLIRSIKRDLPKFRRRILGVSVAERNLPAQLMLKKNGFRWRTTIRRPGEAEDRYVLQYISPK